MTLATPLPPPHIVRQPKRSASLADSVLSVAEGGKPRRRMLTRAANLLTTRGQPVPVLAEVDRTASHPPTATRHRRSHSSSAAEDTTFKLSRRRSDGAATLGLGGSIRRTVSTYLARKKSKTKSKDDPVASPRSPVSALVPVSERSISSQSETTTTSQPARRSTSLKGHIRSASDVLRRRPRVPYSNSDPGFHNHNDEQAQYAAMVTDMPAVTSPGEIQDASPTVQSPENVHEASKRPLSTIHEPADAAAPSQPAPPTIAPLEPATPVSSEPSAVAPDVAIPPLLINGVPMMKVSAKKQKRYFFRLDPDEGQIVYYSKKQRIIPIESIKEIRTGADARYYREQFQINATYEDRWLTITHILDGSYKTVHLIAATRDVFSMWETCLRRLHEIRQQLMSGLGHGVLRQAIWERQFWKGADEENDQKLDFDDVERMCRRLNINPSRDDLLRRFKQADSQNRGWLDFNDFRKFVKALKARPEIDRLFKRLLAESQSPDEFLRYSGFAKFMKEEQKSHLDDADLQRLFVKYASTPTGAKASGYCSPARNPLELAIQNAAISANAVPPNTSTLASESSSSDPSQDSSHLAPTSAAELTPPASPLTHDTGVLTCKAFTSFLLSSDNSPFRDETHDMTHPLPDYYISSSHNTYLVGHQLMGESTIEGYIRALLHSCRSVELDIYDGDTEPVIYHGKTLTSKVPLRDICQAIARYAFATSPYPIIISAEVHCGVPQQALIASIMTETFGDALVKAPVDGRPKIEVLPSPEDLKGKVLLKAKNLYVAEQEGIQEKDVTVDTESSSTETSTSDSDFREDVKEEWKKARQNEADVIKGLRSEFSKAKRVLGRVRSHRNSSPGPKPAISPNVPQPKAEKPKVKMSMELVALLVYTVGVKCRGINKKEVYAPEHIFSLSENTANKILKQGMIDLIKHNKTHLVRIYPKGIRVSSTNYEPHRYWSAGAQLVAINWQTFDLGYMLNHAMFQRNQRAGYVMKPLALRTADKDLLAKRTQHFLDITVISAQQLPRPKDSFGREIIDKSVLDPYVEISLHIPDWTTAPYLPPTTEDRSYSPPANTSPSQPGATSARTVTVKTGVVKNNGFNPVWEQALSLPFDCVGDMFDLVFVRFAVRQEDKDDEEPLAVYCTSLASLHSGYRHLPLHDTLLSQYLFSTLFVQTNIRNA